MSAHVNEMSNVQRPGSKDPTRGKFCLLVSGSKSKNSEKLTLVLPEKLAMIPEQTSDMGPPVGHDVKLTELRQKMESERIKVIEYLNNKI
jgi:hypothetical protein